jgi:hypothetical protein
VRKYIERGTEAPVEGLRSVGPPSRFQCPAYLDFLRERVTAFLELSAARSTREILELSYAAVKRHLAEFRPAHWSKPHGLWFGAPLTCVVTRAVASTVSKSLVIS